MVSSRTLGDLLFIINVSINFRISNFPTRKLDRKFIISNKNNVLIRLEYKFKAARALVEISLSYEKFLYIKLLPKADRMVLCYIYKVKRRKC